MHKKLGKIRFRDIHNILLNKNLKGGKKSFRVRNRYDSLSVKNKPPNSNICISLFIYMIKEKCVYSYLAWY